MSYKNLLPFTPNARFRVVNALSVDGKAYAMGDELPDGLDERLLELLYTQRRIEVIGPKEQAAPKPPKAEKKAEPKVEPEAAPEGQPLKYKVKQAGLGGFKVIAPTGAPVGPGYKTHAEALAEATRLSALEA